MEPHDITSYPLKLPFIRSSKMAKRDTIGAEVSTQDERFVRPSQSNDIFFRRSKDLGPPRGCGPLTARAPIEIQLENFRRQAIEMGFSGPAHPPFGSQPAPRRSAFCAPSPDRASPLFPLARPSSQALEEAFRVGPTPSPRRGSNLDRIGAPSMSDHFGCAFDFSVAEEDSPSFARSQLSHRPFPLAGEPSAMFGALPHDAGFTQAALPTHCHWTAAPKRRAPRGDYRSQSSFMPSYKMFEAATVSPPAHQSDCSLDTTCASPRPPSQPAAGDRRRPPPRLAGHKRRSASTSHVPAKMQFKPGPAASPFLWDSDAELSPEPRSDPLDRGLLALSPIAKSTPCPPPRPPSSSRRPRTRQRLGEAFCVNAAVQTDASTNMPIFRETACSPLAWRRCPSCGCHREAPGPPASPASPPGGRPACRSASGDSEPGSFLTDLLIGLPREE